MHVKVHCPIASQGFQFKHFYIAHDRCAHKVGTDGVMLAAWADLNHPRNVLDIGSGSGLLSLICAQRFPAARIFGIEKDPKAFGQSVENVRDSPFDERISILQDDFTQCSFEQKFDAIISNPPFFESGLPSKSPERDQARATSSLPLALLAEKCSKLLRDNGILALILPKTEAQRFIALAEKEGLSLRKLSKVYGKLGADDKRWLLDFVKGPASPMYETHCLRTENGAFSDWYLSITKDLYLYSPGSLKAK